MSDFLHNLRTGNIKRFDRPRKNYDKPQYRHPHDRQHGKDRKGNYHKKAHTGEQLQEIKKYIEGMAKTIEDNLKAQEKVASALDRIATVLEANAGLSRADTGQADAGPEPPAFADPTSDPVNHEQAPTAVSKEDLMAMIREMRATGLAFEKIAGELEQRKIPTVSGRGKWRGPAVSKLLKENA